MKNKRWLAIILLAAMLFVSCSTGEKEAGVGGSVDASGHITLDFWYALGGDAGTAIEDMVTRFNDSQSDITVVATYQGDYTTAMAMTYSAIAGDTYSNVACWRSPAPG
jgi:sn-glycerol 3-phosphate transport system substrate-binding protein